MIDKFILKLYIAGQTARSETAVFNLRRLCEKHLTTREYEIQIIDVLEQPNLAEEERILATPTLIKYLPPPTRRVIGDLSETEKAAKALGLY